MFPLPLLELALLDCKGSTTMNEIKVVKIWNNTNIHKFIIPNLKSALYLANADCKRGGGSFDLRLLEGRSRFFTGDVNGFFSTWTLRNSVQNLFGDLASLFWPERINDGWVTDGPPIWNTYNRRAKNRNGQPKVAKMGTDGPELVRNRHNGDSSGAVIEKVANDVA